MPSILVNGSVTVPSNFLGIHSGWPIGSATPPTPTLPVTAFRSHDTGGDAPQWRLIEKTAGNYTWTDLDTAMTAWRTAGLQVTYVLYGTPTFYAPTDAGNDPYGYKGGGSYPTRDTDLTAWKAFVNALMTRYNASGGTWRTANPSLGKGITTLQIWNEPSSGSNWWSGTTTQFVDLARAAYLEAKSVDAAITVASPAWVHWRDLDAYMKATGTVYSTAKLADTFDVLAYNIYEACPYGAPRNQMFADCLSDEQGPLPYMAVLRWYGKTANVICTELGLAPYDCPPLQQFLGIPAADRRVYLRRILAAMACVGVKQVFPYSFTNNLCGNLASDTNGVIAAVNDVAAIVGKTIVSADHVCGGALTVTCSDTSTYTF